MTVPVSVPNAPSPPEQAGDCQSPLQSRLPESKWGQIWDMQRGEGSQASSSCGASGQAAMFA